jgi:large subunit ribosomal protein L4
MATLNVYNASGDEVGTYEIEPADLAPRINKQLLHDVVVMYQANLRQGSHQTKGRSDVAATTKKMYRQKGTGNARAGSRVSGIRRGGGHIHNITPRDYSYRLPRKAVRLATRMAMAAKLRDGAVTLIDKLDFAQPKTKEMATILKALNCDQGNVLVTTAAHDSNVYKSGRNIQGVAISPSSDLNALAILKARRLLVTKDAMDAIVERARQATAGSQK